MRSLSLTIAATVLATMLVGCGPPSDGGSGSAAPTAPPVELSVEEKQALLASLPAPYNTADLANGAAKFALCRSCHTIAPGGPNMTGPNLHGVFGREAAQVEGYRYSDVLRGSGIVWDAHHLDAWLANPKTYLPGTKMSFAGLKDPGDRRDLIAFLMVETGHRPEEASRQTRKTP